jgi:hypothetical protein
MDSAKTKKTRVNHNLPQYNYDNKYFRTIK